MRSTILILALSTAACGARKDEPAAPPTVAASPPTAPAASPTAPAASPTAKSGGWDRACQGNTRFRVQPGTATASVFCVRDDGTRHGLFTLYWADGLKAAEGVYADGARAGVWTVWNPTFGKERETLATIEYQNGAPANPDAVGHSWWLHGDAACPVGGQIERTLYDDRTFVTCTDDGTSHGPAAEFHATGHRQAVGAYHHGEQHGDWIGWREDDGTKFGAAHFDNGVETGEWHFWDTSGKLTKVEVYQEGTLVETRTP